MAEIKLLGVFHDEPGNAQGSNQVRISTRLCGPLSDKLFEEKWFPTFDQKSTLLICEGVYNGKILKPEDDEYEKDLGTTSPLLLASDYGPDILYADTRFKNKIIKKRTLENYFKIMDWLNKNRPIGFSYIPNSLEDMYSRYIKGSWIQDYQLLKAIPENIKQFVHVFDALNTEMETYMLEQAEKHKDKYEQILIMTGGSHTLEMHSISGLPFEVLYQTSNRNEIAMHYSQLLLRKGRKFF